MWGSPYVAGSEMIRAQIGIAGQRGGGGFIGVWGGFDGGDERCFSDTRSFCWSVFMAHRQLTGLAHHSGMGLDFFYV